MSVYVWLLLWLWLFSLVLYGLCMCAVMYEREWMRLIAMLWAGSSWEDSSQRVFCHQQKRCLFSSPHYSPVSHPFPKWLILLLILCLNAVQEVAQESWLSFHYFCYTQIFVKTATHFSRISRNKKEHPKWKKAALFAGMLGLWLWNIDIIHPTKLIYNMACVKNHHPIYYRYKATSKIKIGTSR